MLREVYLYSKTGFGSKYHPGEKLLLGVIPLIIIGTKNSFALLTAYLIYFVILDLLFKVPYKMIIKFLILSVGFTALSIIGLMFSGYDFIYILRLFYKTIIGAFAISFIALTTDLDSILYLVSRFDYLKDVCDIAKSMERFLFLVEDEFVIVKNAVLSRDCSKKYKDRLKNFGKIAGCTFKNTIFRWRDIKNALDTRCYNGNINYSKLSSKFSWVRVFIVIIINSLIVVLI